MIRSRQERAQRLPLLPNAVFRVAWLVVIWSFPAHVAEFQGADPVLMCKGDIGTADASSQMPDAWRARPTDSHGSLRERRGRLSATIAEGLVDRAVGGPSIFYVHMRREDRWYMVDACAALVAASVARECLARTATLTSSWPTAGVHYVTTVPSPLPHECPARAPLAPLPSPSRALPSLRPSVLASGPDPELTIENPPYVVPALVLTAACIPWAAIRGPREEKKLPRRLVGAPGL